MRLFHTLLILTLCLNNFCYATLTSYVASADQNTVGVAREDYIHIGGAGTLAGYTTTLTNTTSLTITLIPTGTSAALNSAGPGVATFPSTLQNLTIAGFGAGAETIFGTGAGLQLPTPPANCNIVFNLVTSPSSSCQWFQSAIPSSCTVSVYPNTADPMLTGGILDVSGLTITTGVGLTIPNSSSLSGGQVNAAIRRTLTGVSTYPVLTMGASDTVFNAALTKVGLTGAYHATTNVTSSVYGIDSSVTALTIGTGAVLSIYNMGTDTVPPITLSSATASSIVKGGAS